MQEQESGPDRTARSDSDPDGGAGSGDGNRTGDREERDEHGATTETSTVERGFVETNGIETYYERRGEGPPVVFVHGMVMSNTMWDAQVEALADEYTTVAYDVRGHGRTGGSDVGSYSIPLFAEDLDALLTALDVERPVLCGTSMGGAVAQAYAAAHPGNVAGLVLADTFPAGDLPLAGRLAFANIRFLGWLQRYVDYRRLNRVQMRVGNLLSPGWAGDEVTVQDLVESDPRIASDEFRKIARATAAFPGSDLDLSAVTAPALVLYAENAPAGMQGMASGIRDGLANADVEVDVVPDAGHAVNLDNPEFFEEAVRAFLARGHGDAA
jgi:pimeloyl-ACP methyl ester carboxylesterase